MIRWQSPPLPLSPESDYDKRLQQHLDRLYVSLTQTFARIKDGAGSGGGGVVTYTGTEHLFSTGFLTLIEGAGTVRGTVLSVSGVPATLFSTTEGGWLVSVYLPSALPSTSGYTCFAIAINDGNGMRLIPFNDINMSITMSGATLLAVQSSGLNITLQYRAIRLF